MTGAESDWAESFGYTAISSEQVYCMMIMPAMHPNTLKPCVLLQLQFEPEGPWTVGFMLDLDLARTAVTNLQEVIEEAEASGI